MKPSEMALIKVVNDLLMAADSGSPSILVLLNLSTAFDTVDHNILHHLEIYTMVMDTALKWLTSYLTNHRSSVTGGFQVC